MTVLFKPMSAINAECFFAKEASENVFLEAGAVQVSHRGIPSATLGHSPIDGQSNDGSCQVIIGDAVIRGVHKPAFRATFPFRHQSAEILFNFLFGADHAAGVWTIANNPISYSVGFSNGIKYLKFAGCYMAEATITFSQDSVAEIEVMVVAASLAEAAAGGFPALVPEHDEVPYTILNCTFMHEATKAALDALIPATDAIPFSDLTLSLSRSIATEYYNNPDPTLSPGKFRVSGSMSHRISTEFYTEFAHVAQPDGSGFSTEYIEIEVTSTPGTKLVTIQAPSRWSIRDQSVPNDGLISVSLDFTCGADDGAHTVNTVEVVASAFI